MKYSLFLAALFTFLLVGCGDDGGKPGQYPPSLYSDESGNRMGAPAGQE